MRKKLSGFWDFRDPEHFLENPRVWDPHNLCKNPRDFHIPGIGIFFVGWEILPKICPTGQLIFFGNLPNRTIENFGQTYSTYNVK